MSSSLDHALKMYRTLRACRNEVMRSVNKEPPQIPTELLEATNRIGEKGQDQKVFFKDFFDHLVDVTLFEICFLDAVRTFESAVYELIKEASGNIETIVRDRTSRKKDKLPFRVFAHKFVKRIYRKDPRDGSYSGELRNLGDVMGILKGKLKEPLYTELGAIVTYRNWLAHGNRFSERPPYPGEIQDVVKVLDDILTEINK